MFFDDASTLHEHATRTAGWIEDRSTLGIEDVGDQRDQRNRRKEFAAIVCLLIGELGEEVLIDAPEHVTGRKYSLLA